MFHLAQRKDYMMVETRPVGPGLWCFVCLVWCWVSLFLSPPSDCSSLPSTMTWAPCPHGVRTRGKKKMLSAPIEQRDRCHTAEIQSGHSSNGCPKRKTKLRELHSAAGMQSRTQSRTPSKGARTFHRRTCSRGQRLICAHRFGSSAHTVHGGDSSAHTGPFPDVCSVKRVVKMEWPLPPQNFTLGWLTKG